MGMSSLRNYGLDWGRELREISDEDYSFGSVAGRTFPPESRITYLPAGETQRGKEDWQACASIAPVNILETYFTWLFPTFNLENKKWLEKNNYAKEGVVSFGDREIAILSETTRSGNSLKAPLQTIHDYGLTPKSFNPAMSDMDWDEYHDRNIITNQVSALQNAFRERFIINYERVKESEFDRALETDMLDVALFAWPKPINGIYPRVERSPNHATVLVRGKYENYDSYEDLDGDYIKQLAPNYDFHSHGYRLIVTERQPKKYWWFDIWHRLWN